MKTTSNTNKWNMKSKTVLSLSIASSLFAATASQAAYNLNEDYKFTPNGTATGAVTGALVGTKPWIDLIQIQNAATAQQTAGSTLVMDFGQLSSYVFQDTDKDIDISKKNFTWYTFKNPVSLLAELKGATPPTIEELVARGDAVEIAAASIVETEFTSTLTIPTLPANTAVGFVVQPKTSNGYPLETQENKTLIVPSISFSAKIDIDGKPEWTDLASVKGVTVLDIAAGSNSEQFVPPRDIRDVANINDAIAKIAEWKSVKFTASVENNIQRTDKLDLAGVNGRWTINLSVDGAAAQDHVISTNGTVDAAVKTTLEALGVSVKSGPTYDAVTKTISLELASNKPIKGNVSVDFSSADPGYITEADGNKETYAFYDQPSENIEMIIYDRGPDGKATRKLITSTDPIYPSRVYEVAVLDKDSKVVGDLPTDVTGYFANHIKWTYTDAALPNQFVELARCNGTVMFPTQIDNTKAELEVLALAPTPWANFEQGLRLKPTIALPTGIADGSVKFSRVAGVAMNMCDPTKTGSSHVPYAWF